MPNKIKDTEILQYLEDLIVRVSDPKTKEILKDELKSLMVDKSDAPVKIAA